MNEPEPCAAVRGQYLPILSRRLEKLIGTDDVCLNKYSTVHDRAVDMAFGREMQHRIRLVLAKNPIQCNAIADIGVLEYIARMVSDDGERLWISGVGQLVSINHRDAIGDQAPARRGSDEARPSGDQYAHEAFYSVKIGGEIAERGQTSVLFRNDRLGRCDRPVDAQAHIRPVNAAVVICRIDLVDFIEDYAVR